MRFGYHATVLAMICGVLLLFAPLTGRTMWVCVADDPVDYRGCGSTGTIRHSAGWDWFAPLCGLVAIGAALAGGAAIDHRRAIAASLVAAAAFAVAAGLACGHWHDAASGALDLPGFATHPAPAARFFAGVGLLGACLALALAGWRARPAS